MTNDDTSNVASRRSARYVQQRNYVNVDVTRRQMLEIKLEPLGQICHYLELIRYIR